MNNSVTIVGHLGINPIINNYRSGSKRAYFPVGVKEFMGKGEEPKTIWLDVEAWNEVAERVISTLKKGREVVLNGRLAIATYKKLINGQEFELTKPVIKLISFHACAQRSKQASSSNKTEPIEANLEVAV